MLYGDVNDRESDAIKKVYFDEYMALTRKPEKDGADGEDAHGAVGFGYSFSLTLFFHVFR